MKRKPPVNMMPGWEFFVPWFFWRRCRECGMEFRRELGSFWVDAPCHEGGRRYRCADCTTDARAEWLATHGMIDGKPIREHRAPAPTKGKCNPTEEP